MNHIKFARTGLFLSLIIAATPGCYAPGTGKAERDPASKGGKNASLKPSQEGLDQGGSGGQVSAAAIEPGGISIDDSMPGWVYKGFLPYQVALDNLGNAHGTKIAGSTAEFTFTGTGVDVVQWKGPGAGSMSVTIDGVRVGTVNQANPTHVHNTTLFSKRDLQRGRHTIRFTSNSTAFVMIDQIVIYDKAAATPSPVATPAPAATPAPGGGGNPAPTGSASSGIPGFAQVKAEILDQSCAACHSAAAKLGGIDYSSYAAVMASGTVVAGSPDSSRMYLSAAAGTMPLAPFPRLSILQMRTLSNWIGAGAPEQGVAGEPAATPAPGATPAPTAAPTPTPAPTAVPAPTPVVQAPRVSVIDDSSGGWTFRGFNNVRNNGSNQNTVRQTRDENSFAEREFFGTGIEIITRKARNNGRLQVQIDGVSVGSFSLAANQTNNSSVIYSNMNLKRESHRLRLIATDQDKTVSIDRFNIYDQAPGTVPPGTSAGGMDAVTQRAFDLLNTKCAACHGSNSQGLGNFNSVTDVPRMIATNFLVAGNPANSSVFREIQGGTMPPGFPMPADEVAAISAWITAGAAPFGPAATPAPEAPRPFISDSQVLTRIFNDFRAQNNNNRPNVRYLTFTHLYNVGLPAVELDRTRRALNMAINSLSQNQRITNPVAIDPEKTIFRIDIRNYNWSRNDWLQVSNAYPYDPRLLNNQQNQQFNEMVNTMGGGGVEPFVRADWFMATATRPPLYHSLLDIQQNVVDEARELGVDMRDNIRDNRVIRVGFLQSGVSVSNRIMERHRTRFGGAFWQSYDFAEQEGRQDIFRFPLGEIPASGNNSDFTADGGETIWNLPNGLQAYLLVANTGNRLDAAPTPIVQDPLSATHEVINGLSCIICHSAGMNPNTDELREHYARNGNRLGINRQILNKVQAIYPTKATIDAAFNEDNQRFANALARTEVLPTEVQPVGVATFRFAEDLSVDEAAAELGLTLSNFQNQLNRNQQLRNLFNDFRRNSGTAKIERDDFERNFQNALRLITPQQ